VKTVPSATPQHRRLYAELLEAVSTGKGGPHIQQERLISNETLASPKIVHRDKLLLRD
jgi:hypothetical protein